MNEDEDYYISSADKIVYRVLGNLSLGEKGISLEEILDSLGMKRQVLRMFGKAYRKEWTQKGFEENIRGIGHHE